MRLLYQTLNYESLKLALRLQSLPLQSNRCKIERLFEIKYLCSVFCGNFYSRKK